MNTLTTKSVKVSRPGLKQRIGAVSPRSVVAVYRTVSTAIEYGRDCLQYIRSSTWVHKRFIAGETGDISESINSRALIEYHGLEKGATLAHARRPYGIDKIHNLKHVLAGEEFERRHPQTRHDAERAISATEEFNLTGNYDDEVHPKGPELASIPIEEVEAHFRSRKSVRDYDSARSLDLETVERVVQVASLTPSVCNRRAFRAHYFSDRETIDDLLELQNGNRGFGSTVPALFVVSMRRSSFVGAGERNQRWIDGGLFAMNLVWALHSQGIATCFLNWSEVNAKSKKLRARAGIASSEDVVVLIACGYAAPSHRVARSPRRALDEVLVLHRPESAGL